MICLVRHVSWIIGTVERQFRQNLFEHTRLFNSASERSSVHTRVEALAGAMRLVGYSWRALREACYSNFADRLVLLDCDLLVRRPTDVMALLYDFLEEEPFAHDFQAVDYDAPRLTSTRTSASTACTGSIPLSARARATPSCRRRYSQNLRSCRSGTNFRIPGPSASWPIPRRPGA